MTALALDTPQTGETRFVEMVFPEQANHYGTLFGGNALSLMGKAAFVAATRRAGARGHGALRESRIPRPGTRRRAGRIDCAGHACRSLLHEGRTAKGWNVILPVDVVERRFEGL